jgi:hypothetical protein
MVSVSLSVKFCNFTMQSSDRKQLEQLKSKDANEIILQDEHGEIVKSLYNSYI